MQTISNEIKKPTPGQIIAKYQSTAPVDVVGIANDLGINVWESSKMNPDVSGKLFLDPMNGGPSGFSMVVRKGDSLARKRFTIAHEIAHFILHRNQFKAGSDFAMHRGGISGKEETQANGLAAEILMPYTLIQQLIREGNRTPEALAQRLGVSKAAIGVRLGILNI